MDYTNGLDDAWTGCNAGRIYECLWKTVQTGQFKLDSSCVDSQEYESLPRFASYHSLRIKFAREIGAKHKM